MNILITGQLSFLASSLALSFSKDDHKVVMAGEEASISDHVDNVITHPFDPSIDISREALSSYDFDIVIFIGTREEDLLYKNGNGNFSLDGLVNVLNLSVTDNVKKFFFISSSEIFAESDDSERGLNPNPGSIQGHLLVEGERICALFNEFFHIPITIIRVPFLFDFYETTSFIGNLLVRCQLEREILLPVSKESQCDFVNVLDVYDFIIRVSDDEIFQDLEETNLSTGKSMTYLELSDLIGEYLPDSVIKFTGNNEILTLAFPEIDTDTHGWIAHRLLPSEIENLIEKLDKNREYPEKSGIKKGLAWYQGHSYTKWFELLGGIVLIHLLSEMTGTFVQFKYVDFRLFYVVLLSSVYGLRFGIFAALLASLSIFYTWFKLSLDWSILTYNVGNWFPLVVYFVSGLAIGHLKDKKDNEIEELRNQKDLVYDKFAFLFDVFNEVSSLKDDFKKQIINYRDSFGKIYKIASDLDNLNPDEVFLNAVVVLEEIMDSDEIAIYTIESEGKFLRLEAHSPGLIRKIKKSITLSDYPDLQKKIEMGEIFQNVELLTDYPAFATPVIKDQHPIALVVIWNVRFEQNTLYYFNLFKVITNLIRDSLIRATMFSEANIDQLYFPSTKIFKPEALAEALRLRMQMKQMRITDYQVLMLENENRSPEEIYSITRNLLRAVDLIGLWEDNNYYVLLSMADERSVNAIIERMHNQGLISEKVKSKDLFKKVNNDR
jgi:UDP-glucose 4-epimerase